MENEAKIIYESSDNLDDRLKNAQKSVIFGSFGLAQIMPQEVYLEVKSRFIHYESLFINLIMMSVHGQEEEFNLLKNHLEKEIKVFLETHTELLKKKIKQKNDQLN